MIFVSSNDKVQTRILLSRSLSWKSFAASMKRTKWLWMHDEKEKEEEMDLDDNKPPNQCNMYE